MNTLLRSLALAAFTSAPALAQNAVVLDPKLPDTVSTITLSYAFFGVGTGIQPQAAIPSSVPRAGSGLSTPPGGSGS